MSDLPPLPTGAILASDIDTRTGAPASVRAAVGAAQTPQDRLATLRRFAPDARPFGEENFLYTDRRTGRLTVYNPKGLDWGDAASVLPEASEFAGGAVGAAAALPPALATAPATGGASLLAVPAGAGLGAAAGRELATLTGRMFNGTVDTRSLPQHVADAGVTAGMNAAMIPAGNAMAAAGRAMFGPVQRMMGAGTGPAALADFANAGVTPSAGAITGNRSVQVLEKGLEMTPGGVEPIRSLAERQAAEAGTEARRVAGLYGTPTDPIRVGNTVREGAEAAVGRFRDRQRDLYDTAFNMIGADTPVPLNAVNQLQQDLAAQVARAPASRQQVLAPVLQRIERLQADAAQGGVPFDAFRAIRTDLRRILDTPATAATAPSSDTSIYLDRLYGALTQDMSTAASSVSPEAARALRVADRYTRFGENVNMPALERILSRDLDRDVFRMVFPQNGKPDAQALARIRRNLTPDEWSAVQATVIDRMGIPTPGANNGEAFSVSTFLTNWNRLAADGDAARRVLFGGSGQNAQLATELDRLARVTARLRDTERLANPSGTARNMIAGGGLLAMGQQLGEGDLQNAAGIAAFGLVAPRYTAQLITSPGFVRWLAGAAPILQTAGRDRAIARLAGVASANPELREAIDAYRMALTDMPAERQQR